MTPLAARHGWNACRSASVSGAGRVVCVYVWPPVLIDATMFGTVPVSCSHQLHEPGTALVTPGKLRDIADRTCGKLR